ncbi:MAG: stage 0 sporulation family protein [Eubacteriales bacterium]|nr:stage 0 sporulation family protein [Eubacteriales bacterium]
MMTSVISVRFRSGCKTYFFDPKGVEVKAGQDVIVETAQGLEYAQCSVGNHLVDEAQVIQPLRPLVRIATDNDRRTAAYHREREKEAFDICQKKILQHNLDMKLVRVECSFDGSKILFFFTADGRVDFRDLVKDLAGVFRSRIELRQIGVRDEAKMLGGLGICGRPFCCAQFMDDFVPVSIKMAKTQNLSLNPTKISGTCGRLMCCLKYEQDAYEDAIHRMPKSESFVITPDGTGNVSDINVLKETVNVRLDDRPESPKCYHNCEVCVLRNGKGSRDGIAVPEERPQRYVQHCEEESFTALPMMTAPETAQPETTEKYNHHSRRGRGGKNPAQQTVNAEPNKPEEKREVKAGDRPNHNRRRHRGGQKNTETKNIAPAKTAVPQSTEGGERKKPRHRGGRRHNHGRSSAPKAES